MSEQDLLSRLADRLDTARDRLSTLDGCTPEQLAALDEAVAAAMDREDVLVEKGLKDAVKIVPRPLRGTATRLLFGERGRG